MAHREQVKKQAGFTAFIEVDESPENPRETQDTLTTIVAFHRRYAFGDKTDYRQEDYSSWDELRQAIIENEHPIIIEPLYAYIHGGVVVKTTPFSDQWDSGQIGFVFIPYSRVKEVAACSPKKPALTAYYDSHMYERAIAKQIVEDEVTTYNRYLEGDFWLAFVEGPDGEIVETVDGLEGREDAKHAALEMLKEIVQEARG